MIDSLDWTRHAVFEASAGTGKTHAIGDIVLRLIGEQRCRLDKILLVTFTEKATGELKHRLRTRIEGAIAADPARAHIFQPELDRFDRAAISTIHGFCTRVLQDYASDLGQDFQSEFADDAVLRIEALRDVQRKDWPAKYGSRLQDVLAASGYDRLRAEAWESRVLGIVSRYRPECRHRLVPVSADEEFAAHELMIDTIARTRERMLALKRERGTISFDDIIERVATGLDPAVNPRAPVVIAALREQYQFAIVDEFQDTDVLQWSIFRRVFLEGENTRLIVVGDPKQAIYAFRGADLPTYVGAVEEMLTQRGAVECPLAVNWRSSPAMIDGLNQFFAKGEFFPTGGIAYVPVSAPPEPRRTGLTYDASGRPAVTIVDINGPEKTAASKAREAFAEFTAAEIARLLAGEKGRPLLRIKTATGDRPLTAADICLLVFARAEAADFTAALRKRGIPYSFYKSGKIRESAEATDITRVLRAIAYPEEDRYLIRALFTIFFRASPMAILTAGGVAADHPGRLLVQKWRHLAGERQWSELFASTLEETGVLFHEPSNPDYDRRIANLKLLLGRLQFAAYQKNLDMFELLDLHENASPDPERETDDQPLETDEPRVRIMTMHAAKGLEFPIVFIAARFGNDKRDGDIITYRDDDERLVFDLTLIDKEERKGSELAERIRLQRLDELRRLYYVALTRPQFKLYVPFMNPKSAAQQAPVSTLLAPAIERSDLANAGSFAGAIDVFAELEGWRSQELAEVGRLTLAATEEPLRLATLLPAFDEAMNRRRAYVESFTSLHRKAKREQAEAFGERPDRLDEVHEAVAVASDPFRGPVFGEMVHEVFERIDFAAVEAASKPGDLDGGPAGRLIADRVAHFLPRLVTRGVDERLREQCRIVMRDMVWKALRTPLAPLGDRLSRLLPRDCLNELEFLYAKDERSGRSEFVTGFMDLVFRWQGKIYLLDWKTNVLPAYDRASMEAAMHEAGYHLQYSLYWQALSLWLGSSVTFGGVLYVFLRGLNGVDDADGVYYVPASDVAARAERDG